MTNPQKQFIMVNGERSFADLVLRYDRPAPSPANFSLHTMKSITLANRLFGFFLVVCASALPLVAQGTSSRERDLAEASSSQWWFGMFIIMAAGLGIAFYLWRKSKKGTERPEQNYKQPEGEYGDVDAAKELEWLRKATKPGRKTKRSSKGQTETSAAVEAPDTRIFQERMRRMQYAQLPINLFKDLKPSRPFTPLELSNDPALISAIEQANEEFEEDDAVRELALRILMAFRKINSVDALSQIALYDLSSNLRSKAVTALADFDHESVFETILLACADPTREVRAAAARGLFRLNFDRADAWKRIIETNDPYRMTYAARAAIEGDIVSKSFDRLIHEDTKVAYEAFALVSLLIHAGELDEIFEGIRSHKDERVKMALLHVLEVSKSERVVDPLKEMSLDSRFTTDVAERIRTAIAQCETVSAQG